MRHLVRALGVAGVLIVSVTFYTTRGELEPRMYSAFCVDERGELYTLGAHTQASKGGLLDCTEEGWVAASNAVCEETDHGAETKPPALPSPDHHR